MNCAPRLFVDEIPDDLVLKFFNTIGIKNFSDCHYWSKSVLTPEICQILNSLIPELEPYYYPHKSFIVQRNMTAQRYIQIIRQLARAKGLKLESKDYKDKNQNRKKIILYRLVGDKINPEPRSEFLVSFN
jgi:hypothetical protein